MKKSLVVLILASILISACSQYTCPTYTKKDARKDASQTKI